MKYLLLLLLLLLGTCSANAQIKNTYGGLTPPCDTCLVNLLECPSSTYLDNAGECLDYEVGDTTIQVYAQQLIYQDCDTSYVQSIQYTDATGNIVTTDSCQVETSVVVDSSSCRWEINLVSVSDTSKRTIDMYVNDDETSLNKVGRFIITNCNGIVRDFKKNVTTSVRSGYANPFAFENGGYMVSYRLASNKPGNEVIDIPLEPATATLSGCAGVINANDLIFDAANPSLFISALKIATQNNLCVLGFQETANYKMSIGGTAQINITFTPKHNPDGLWAGVDRNNRDFQYHTSTTSGLITTNSTVNSQGGGPFRHREQTPCGELRFSTNAILPGQIDFSQTNWDTIAFVEGPITYTINESYSILSRNCEQAKLVAQTNCTNSNFVITWDTGQTGDRIDDDGNTHTFDVDNCQCSSLSPCETENEENNTSTLDYLLCVGDSTTYRVVETYENGLVSERKTYSENGATVPFPDFYNFGQCMKTQNTAVEDECEGLGRWASKTIREGESFNVPMYSVWSVNYIVVEGTARVANIFFDFDGTISTTIDTLSTGFAASKSTGDECRYFQAGNINIQGLESAKIKVEYLW